MTKWHQSPKTGEPGRCRARIACAYGETFGAVIHRDGTVDVGTASATVKDMSNPPTEHSTERIVVDENGELKNIWLKDALDRLNESTNTTAGSDTVSPTDSTTISEDSTMTHNRNNDELYEPAVIEIEPDETPNEAGGTYEYRGAEFINGYPKLPTRTLDSVRRKPGLMRFVEEDFTGADYVEIDVQVKHPNQHIDPSNGKNVETYRDLVFENTEDALLFQLKDRDEAETEAQQIAATIANQYTNDGWNSEVEEKFQQLRELDTQVKAIPERPEIEDEYGRFEADLTEEESQLCEKYYSLMYEISGERIERAIWSEPLDQKAITDGIMKYWESEQS